MSEPEFHFGYDPDTRQFVLWQRGRSGPVAWIGFADALGLAATVARIAADRFPTLVADNQTNHQGEDR